MEIKNLQEKIRNWNGERFPTAPSYLALIKVMSELGELADHYINRIERRVGKEYPNPQDGIEDSVADILISLCVFCEREHIELDKMVTQVWKEVSKRTFVFISQPQPEKKGEL
jgi:hypothetical protein